MKDLKDKVAVVTGAGSGIGRALALGLADYGCNLAISDINAPRLKETEEMLSGKGVKVHAFVLDAGNREAVHEYALQVEEYFKRVDIVINNAGVALSKVTAEDVSYEDFDWIMNVNLWGMIAGSKAFLPFLKQQKEAVLVNISSLFGLMGVAYQVPYCTTKFAIRGFTEALRMELMMEAPQVHAFAVHPGGIKTNIARDSRVVAGTDRTAAKKDTQNFEKFFITEPEEAARQIIAGIRKKKDRVVIGRDAKLPDFIIRLLPGKYTRIVGNELKKKMAK